MWRAITVSLLAAAVSRPGKAQGPNPIPATFFGMHQDHMVGCDTGVLSYPLFTVPAGSFRTWDSCRPKWGDMNPAAGVFDFSGIDNALSLLHDRGIDDAYVTLGGTPTWISSDPSDGLCDYAGQYGEPAGMCRPPSDINQDGTGTDSAWRAFATALLQHLTAPAYASGHARVHTFEIWNEFARSDTVGFAVCHAPGAGTPCSYRGTFAQMLRMTQDLRCIARGNASDPITATGQTCANAGFVAVGLEPQAEVLEGNAGPGNYQQAARTLQNYLYCNGNPPDGSYCNYGKAGSEAVDAIAGHPYFVRGLPEDVVGTVTAQKALLSPVDIAKAYHASEGSWGNDATISTDPVLQGGYVARWYLALWIAGIDRGYWYVWDGPPTGGGVGQLWSPDALTSPLTCTVPGPDGGFICSGGIAYAQAYAWLVGATVTSFSCPGSCAQPDAGIYVLDLTRDGGYSGRIAWDSTATAPCANPQCGMTPFAAPGYTVQWRDLAGVTHAGAPTQVGGSPILMEYGNGFLDAGGPDGESAVDGGGTLDGSPRPGADAATTGGGTQISQGCGCTTSTFVVAFPIFACAVLLRRKRLMPGATRLCDG
jgi:hypothetical protein